MLLLARYGKQSFIPEIRPLWRQAHSRRSPRRRSAAHRHPIRARSSSRLGDRPRSLLCGSRGPVVMSRRCIVRSPSQHSPSQHSRRPRSPSEDSIDEGGSDDRSREPRHEPAPHAMLVNASSRHPRGPAGVEAGVRYDGTRDVMRRGDRNLTKSFAADHVTLPSGSIGTKTDSRCAIGDRSAIPRGHRATLMLRPSAGRRWRSAKRGLLVSATHRSEPRRSGSDIVLFGRRWRTGLVARPADPQMVPQSTSLAPQCGDALVRACVGDSGF